MVTLYHSVYKLLTNELLRWNEVLIGIDLTYFDNFDTIRA